MVFSASFIHCIISLKELFLPVPSHFTFDVRTRDVTIALLMPLASIAAHYKQYRGIPFTGRFRSLHVDLVYHGTCCEHLAISVIIFVFAREWSLDSVD